MRKYVVLLAGIAALGVVAFAVQTLRNNISLQSTAAPSAVLRIEPPSITQTLNATGSFAVYVVPNSSLVTAAEMVLTYDPAVIQITGITAGNFFTGPASTIGQPNEPMKNFSTPGKIHYAIGFPLGSNYSSTTTDIVATVSYKAIGAAVNSPITFVTTGHPQTIIADTIPTNALSSVQNGTITVTTTGVGGVGGGSTTTPTVIASGPTATGILPTQTPTNTPTPTTILSPTVTPLPTATPGPTFTPVPTSLVCDQCGYCVGKNPPSEYPACVSCVYGTAGNATNPETQLSLPTRQGYQWTVAGCIETDIGGFTNKTMRFFVSVITGIIFLIMLYGGFLILTSHGNSGKIYRGRKLITTALVAGLVVLFATFILRQSGSTLLKIPGIG